MLKYHIFGCRTNKYFASRWINYLSANVDADNFFFISSCVVTDRAKIKWLKLILQKIQENKQIQIFLTGCATLHQGKVMPAEQFYAIYPELSSYQDQIQLLPEDIYDNDDNNNNIIIKNQNIYTKKFLVIQNGCDNYCKFCLSIYKRGPHRSMPIDNIISEIQHFISHGGQEIVLTGVNIGAWGTSNSLHATASKLADLLEKILVQTRIPRIRLSSIGPEYIQSKLLKIFQNERIMPFFHLAIQHFSDQVLQAMHRNYNAAHLDHIITSLQNLKRSDQKYISIGADLIIGFPGESDIDYEDNYKKILKYNLTRLHIFPFCRHSKYETVPASSLPDKVPDNIIKQRVHKIIKLGNELREKFINFNKNKIWPVLLEQKKNGKWIGYTPNYLEIQVEGNYKKGQIINIIHP